MHRTVKFLILLIAWFSIPVFAEDGKAPSAPKAQGVDLVTDTAAAIVVKSFALLSGNLEFTMAPDTPGRKGGDNYTKDAIGQTVPKSTAIERRK